MFTKLDLAALAVIDNGRLAKAFEKLLSEMREDCADRPALGRPRKLTLTVIMTPECNEDATDLVSCDVGFELKTTMPKKQTRAYNMRARGKGLEFNEESPDDVRQTTLGLAGAAKAAKGGE